MHMRKISSLNIIIGFLNVLNELKKPLMQIFVFFWVKREVYIQYFGSEIYILSLAMAWKHLWHWNMLVFYLVTVIQAV